MFETLETTAVSIWVGESLWAYPILLSLHVIGLAVVVGLFVVRDLRLLGLFSTLPLNLFLPLARLAWIGFIINAISGILLFTSQASIFVHNTAFLVKISSIVIAMVVAGVIQSRLRSELRAGDDVTGIRNSMRFIAMGSLTLWAVAIIAGRLIAYV